MKAGTEYEQFVKSVYEAFLAQEGLTLNVEMHKILKGKSGANHEIDVYWQFEIAGKIYKTAVECKHYNSTVEKGHVQEFCAKLNDIGNLSGIMATKKGYQKGALTFGHYNQIEMLIIKEPTYTDFSENSVLGVNIILNIICPKIIKRDFKFDKDWMLQRGFVPGHYLIRATNNIARIDNRKTNENLSVLDFENKYVLVNKNNEIAPNKYAVNILFDDAYFIDNAGKTYRLKEVNYEYIENVYDKEIKIDALNAVEAIIKRVKDGSIIFMKRKE